ncbi:MAG: nucleotidyltransferase domain-containing protein [Acetatifactor sp.]|nr:nucleotidyltransferase domain-containing protein [Acetatifactor sp.]
MYPHHRESLKNMTAYFQEKKEVIALILGGSVAKGCARPDSDLDAMAVLSEQDYEVKAEKNATAETIGGLCTYDGGYFDVKYMTKQFLYDAAVKGSEPARNAFLSARVLFSRDPEIENIVAGIPVFQTAEKEEKMLSFYSNFWLNYYYFLKSCPIDGYMKLRAVSEVIYSIYRMVLQENEILFPCNRRLEEFVGYISEDTARLTDLGKKFAASLDMADGDAFVKYYMEITSWHFPTDLSQVLSRYTADFEQWWRVPRPNINEW